MTSKAWISEQSPLLLKSHNELGTALARFEGLSRWRRLAKNPFLPLARRLGLQSPACPQEDFISFRPCTESDNQRLASLPSGFITDASFTPDSAQWVYNMVAGTKPKAIIECGCGISTIMISLAIGQKNIQFISLEQDAYWMEKTQAALAALDLADKVRLIHAPLTEVSFKGMTYQAHDDSRIEDIRADLLLVDAPPQSVGRTGVLPRMLPHLNSGALVVLDDAARISERECVKSWVDGGLASFDGYLALGRGLGLLTA